MNRQIYDNYVFEVIKHGNLTNAAKALRISQPALSQGLNALEKEIGLKIFNRKATPITLTPEGELYYRHISRIAVLNDNFDKEINSFRDQAQSRAVIGAPAVYVQSIIGPAILAMDKSVFQISIKTASVENLIHAAEEGKIDCFISTTEELPDTFETRFVCQEEIVFCVPADSQITSLNFAQLQTTCFISLGPQFPLQQAVDELMLAENFAPRSRIIIDQVSEAVNIVEQGIGVCFASKEAAINRNVRTIPTDLIGRKIYIAYDKELYRTKACDELIRAIINHNQCNYSGRI